MVSSTLLVWMGFEPILYTGSSTGTNYGHINSPASTEQLGLSLVNFQVLYISDRMVSGDMLPT